MRYILLLSLIACGGSVSTPGPTNEPTATTPATTVAEVRSTIPAEGDADIAITSFVTVVFGTAMDAATINDQTIHFTDGTAGMVSWRGGRTATLLPKGGLKKSTTYTVVVSADVKTEDGARLGKDYTFSFTTVEGTAKPADTTAPTVISTTPSAAGNASIDTTITATFSEEIDAATVSGASFFVGKLSGAIKVSGKTITFTPSTPLGESVSYKATLTTAITDLAGNPLASKHEWSFTTSAAPDVSAPALQAIVPTDGAVDVALDQQITLAFSEAVKAQSVTSTSVRLEDDDGWVACSRSVSGTTIELTPSKALSYGKTYTIIVTGAVTDAAGNAVTAFTRSFTTLPEPDTQAPVLLVAAPTDAATGVDVNTVVTFQFDEALAAATVILANVTFRDGAAADVAFSVSYAANTITITPGAPLAAATSYTVSIGTGVTDLAGNPLAGAASTTFTTN